MVKPGTLCFAKVKGYSPWPARINVLPKDVKIPRGKIPVFFYGTHEVCYVNENDIFDYEKYRKIYGTYKEKNVRFNRGMKELRDNPKILQLGHDKNAIKYLSQFYEFNRKLAESLNHETIEVKIIDKQDKTVADNVRKRHLSTSSCDDVEIKKAKKTGPITSVNHLKSVEVDFVSKIKEKSSNEGHEKSKKASVNHLKSIEVDFVSKIKETEPITSVNHLKSVQVDFVSKIKEKSSNEGYEKAKKAASITSLNHLKSVQVDFVSKIKEKSSNEGHEERSEKFIDEVIIKDSKIQKNDLKFSAFKNNVLEIFHNDEIESQSIIPTSFKSPIKNIDVDRPKRASAIKFQETLKSYIQHSSQQQIIEPVEKIDVSNQLDTEKMIKRQHSNISKRNKESASYIHRSQSLIQHPKTTEINEEERNLRIVSELSVIDKEIKRSLIVGQEDNELCLRLMFKLSELKNLKLLFLCKVSEIVTTMRKCRRYKKDDTIKARASEMYQRFYHIYEQSDIDEKIEAGAELLKRDNSNHKSAQMLMDEIFVPDFKNHSYCKHGVPSAGLSSPGSAPSHQSSCGNTPVLLPVDQDSMSQLDHIVLNINELLKNGTLELIEVYDADKDFIYPCEEGQIGKCSFNNELELYKQLGV